MAVSRSDALVLFGVTGDLAHKMTFPALYAMVKHGTLKVPIIGVAFPKWSLERLHKRVTDSIKRSGGIDDKRAFQHLLSLFKYVDSHAPCKGTQFPICSAEEQWEKNWQKYLKGVEPAAQKMIRDLQPCFRMSAVPENDPLSILNVLCNSDKHRAVTLTLAYSHDLTVRVHANDGKVHVWRATEPLYAGDVHTIPLNLDPASIQPSARLIRWRKEKGRTLVVRPWLLRLVAGARFERATFGL